MSSKPANSKAPREQNRGLHQVFMEDLRRTQLRRDYLQDLKQLYHFYLDDESRTKLDGMGRVHRAFSLIGWIIKSLVMKLSPARRLLLLVSFVVMILGDTSFTMSGLIFSLDLRPVGYLVLLVILALELRDKLLAKDEIEVARQVQLALLPRRHPEVPGWEVWSHSRPANDVGGDLVDYIELAGFRHGVVLGDVAGKGLGAALLMAKLQATLRAIVPDAVSLDDLGKRVNDSLCRDGLDNRFATLFFAELEHNSGQLRYLNAGHNPPFVIRPGSFDKLAASSYPLGMLAAAKYEEGVVDLLPGDMLLAYSDGLTDATNDAGEDFGAPRLSALLPELRQLSPQAIGERILQEVDRFLGDARLEDDLSLVVIVRR